MIKMRRIRWKAWMLCLAVCAFFMCGRAYAEEIEGTYTYYTSGIENEKAERTGSFYYRDSFFDCSSYDLNMELAALSMRLSFAGFGVGETSEATNLLPFFDQLGFSYSEDTERRPR